MSIGCSNMFKQLRLHGLTSWVGDKSLLPGEGRRWDCYWWLLRGMPRFFYIFPGCSCECESPHPMVHWHDPSPDGVSQTVGQWDDGPDNPHFLKEPSFPTVEGLTQFEWDYKSLLFIIENYWGYLYVFMIFTIFIANFQVSSLIFLDMSGQRKASKAIALGSFGSVKAVGKWWKQMENGCKSQWKSLVLPKMTTPMHAPDWCLRPRPLLGDG